MGVISNYATIPAKEVSSSIVDNHPFRAACGYISPSILEEYTPSLVRVHALIDL
jgi:hypothetical protein